jgi:glycosyltransferase involved in cell wall biosynthesis
MKIEVVTITKDNDLDLDKTLTSILNCPLNDVFGSIVIVDGGSGEHSLLWSNKDSRIQLIKESDAGIFDAMNKGWLVCKNQWVIFMNAGDEFYSEIDSKKLLQKLSSTQIEWAVGDSLLQNKQGEYTLWSANNVSKYKFSRGFNSFPHQATFYNKQKILDEQLFRTDSKIADWERSLQLLQIRNPVFLNQTICINEPFESSASLGLITWCFEVSAARNRLKVSLGGSKRLDFWLQVIMTFMQRIKSKLNK